MDTASGMNQYVNRQSNWIPPHLRGFGYTRLLIVITATPQTLNPTLHGHGTQYNRWGRL